MKPVDILNEIKDFPKPGINFYDIQPLIADPFEFGQVVTKLCKPYSNVDFIVGVEARGFIFSGAMAKELNAGTLLARKPGKLPLDTIYEDYGLEYKKHSRIEMQKGLIKPGQNVVIVDDLLATGGTAAAACRLVKRLGGNIVGICFVVELVELDGRKKLQEYGDVNSLIMINKTI